MSHVRSVPVFPLAQISHGVIKLIPLSPFAQTTHSYGQWLLCVPYLSSWIIFNFMDWIIPESLPFFFTDPPWSSKVLPVFLWQEGKHCCPTDLMALTVCVQRNCKEQLIPALSSFVSWWEKALCSYLGESCRHLSRVHNPHYRSHPGTVSVAGRRPLFSGVNWK